MRRVVVEIKNSTKNRSVENRKASFGFLPQTHFLFSLFDLQIFVANISRHFDSIENKWLV